MIYFCHGQLKETFSEWFSQQNYSQLILLADKNTLKYCLPFLKGVSFYHTIIIESGEEHKNLDTCQEIWEHLTRLQIDRKALLINLGGGVIGDMGGFCAAVYKRGIDFVQIPTTLLAQVDASIGGKLGVDFSGYKNQLGTFKEPSATFIDAHFLKTLPPQELLSGFAEIIKHCLIKDAYRFNEIKNTSLPEQDWPKLIEHSVAIKQKVVQADPYEYSERKILNFGHTIGHALEGYLLRFSERKILHGHAVAAGMLMESYLSSKYGSLSATDFENIASYLSNNFPKIFFEVNEIENIVEWAYQDKKNLNKEIKAVMLLAIGQAQWDVKVEALQLKEALEWYIRTAPVL